MSDQNVLLLHGASAPTQLNVNLQANTLIINSSTVNSIWVSNSPAMTSGVGTRIGPLGSGRWIDSGNAYAINDNAATTDTTIRLTTSMIDVVDPVAVGVAVATQLFATGVKSVLVEQPIRTGVSLLRNSQTEYIDVSQWDSVLLNCIFSAVNNEQVSYFFATDTSGVDISYREYYVEPGQRIPVRDAYLVIVNASLSTDVTYTLTGSNRGATGLMDENIAQLSNVPAVYQAASQAWVVGANAIVPSVFNNAPGGASPNPTGDCYLTASFSTGTALRGIINCSYLGGDGTIHTVPLCDTGEAHLDWTSGAMFIYKKVSLPNCLYQIQFQPRVPGTSSVTVSLTKTAS